MIDLTLVTPESLQEALHFVEHENSGGSRELDCRIYYAFGFDFKDRYCRHRTQRHGPKSWRHHITMFGFTAAWLSDHVYGDDSAILPISSDIGATYRFIGEVLPRADWISVARDPSGVGAYVASWRLAGEEPTPYFEGRGVHYCETLALLAALIAACQDMKARGYPW